MAVSIETVYLGHDNSIELILKSDGVAVDLAAITDMTVSIGDAYRDERCAYGSPNSLHRLRLAIDLNLFRDGVFLTSTNDHLPLGEFLESIGGTWGGRFGDGNHYSLAYGGKK
jgi:hypothetical protein